MYEAQGLAARIADFLQGQGIADGGANYAIVVTDTAGNVAEVFTEEGRWVMDEEVNMKRLALRCRVELMTKQEERRKQGMLTALHALRRELEDLRLRAADINVGPLRVKMEQLRNLADGALKETE